MLAPKTWDGELELCLCFRLTFPAVRRLDYYLVSERFMENVADCIHRKEVYGSDHCPLVLKLKLPA